MPRPLIDPETAGLIKLALQEKRAIEAGRMKPEDSLYLPSGTTVKDGEVVLPPTGAALAAGAAGSIAVGYGAIALGILAVTLLISYARAGLIYEVRGLPLYLPLSLAIGCFLLGSILLWAREIRQWRSAAVAQVTLGVSGSVAGFLSTPDPIGRWIVFAGAAVAVADALNILRKRPAGS